MCLDAEDQAKGLHIISYEEVTQLVQRVDHKGMARVDPECEELTVLQSLTEAVITALKQTLVT